MVPPFGYKITPSPPPTQSLTKSARKIQSAPDTLAARSHGLFAALSANASFDLLTYPPKHLQPRNQFLLSLFTKTSLDAPRPFLSVPPTLCVSAAGAVFIAGNELTKKIKSYPDLQAIPEKDIKQMLMRMARRDLSDQAAPLAIIKRAKPGTNSNETTLVYTLPELERAIATAIQSPSPASSAVVIQKYVRPKGAQAWLVRIVYKSKQHTGTDGYSYVLNDTDPLVTNRLSATSCSIVKSASAKSWAEPRAMFEKFVAYAEVSLNTKFKMLAGDFVMDADNTWWFLQVKAFERRDDMPIGTNDENASTVTTQQQPATKNANAGVASCIGDYCEEVLNAEDRLLYPNPSPSSRHLTTYKDILVDRLLQKHLKEKAEKVAERKKKLEEREKEYQVLMGLDLDSEEMEAIAAEIEKDREEEAMEAANGNLMNVMAGVDVQSLEKRLLQTISKRDRMKLYDSMGVCPSCHNRYSHNKKLVEAASNVEAAAKKIKAKEKRMEREMTEKAALDARIRGGRGAVGLDDFMQNAKSQLKGGNVEGGLVGGGGLVMDGAVGGMSTDHLEDIQRVPTRQRAKNRGRFHEVTNTAENSEDEGEGGGGEEEEEEEERETIKEEKEIEQRVEDTFDGYNPTFDINIDDIMNSLESEMDAIRIGGKDPSPEKQAQMKKNGVKGKEMPRFRPMSEIAVDEHQFWASDSYKEELVNEIREDLTRGLRVKVTCEATTLESELKSMMHSIFHEDEVKRNTQSSNLGEEDAAVVTTFSFMAVPKLNFMLLDEESKLKRVEMVLHPCN
jgi:hypothetical protein